MVELPPFAVVELEALALVLMVYQMDFEFLEYRRRRRAVGDMDRILVVVVVAVESDDWYHSDLDLDSCVLAVPYNVDSLTLVDQVAV